VSVRLADLRWRAIVNTVQLGPRSYRVVRAADQVPAAGLYETGWYSLDMHVDQRAAVDLAMAWGLAIRSPHTLIYLPLNRSREGVDDRGQPLDLVLLHHSLAFAPSRWRQVRARLDAGTPLRVTLPSGTFAPRPLSEHRQYIHQGFRDHLRWDVAADTLFLVGSGQAFRLGADQIRGLVEDGPGYAATRPGGHYCAEINVGRPRIGYPDKRGPCSELHILYDSTPSVR
jgi:hypothetical protein